MIFISHRGNIRGRNPERENHPYYIEEAIQQGYDVEIDVWYKDNILWFGHDEPVLGDAKNFIRAYYDKLLIHCKNPEAASFLYAFNQKEFLSQSLNLHYFTHETDTIAFTSQGWMLAYPGKQPIKDTIAMMPEVYNDDVSKCIGICSDDIAKYKEVYG